MPLERHHRMEATGAWDVWMVVLCLAANVVSADEAVLPDPLVMNSGERVTTPEQVFGLMDARGARESTARFVCALALARVWRDPVRGTVI